MECASVINIFSEDTVEHKLSNVKGVKIYTEYMSTTVLKEHTFKSLK